MDVHDTSEAFDPAKADATGARSDARRRRSRRLVAVATGTMIALSGGGAAWAATTDPTPEPTPTPKSGTDTRPDAGRPEGDHVPPRGVGPHHHFAFGLGTLHGEAVVETEEGVYETIATQRGTVDEVDDDSITITSEDGYTATYVIDLAELEADHPAAGDPADLAVGDEVVVAAVVEGDTATVRHVIDLADLPEPPLARFGEPGGEHSTPGDAGWFADEPELATHT